MAYRYGDRYQMSLIPQSIEDFVPEDSPVRAYDEFIESLDFQKLGIDIDPDKVGNPEYDPRAMLKLLIFSYSYGIKSSRRIERECHNNMCYIWLTGGLKPDHKTIAEFRRKNKGILRKVFQESVKMCIGLNLIKGNVLFVDGTKIRANANRGQSYKKSHYHKILARIDDRITDLLKECEAVDKTEKGQGSWVRMDKELSQKQRLRERIREALSAFGPHDTQINMTDPDSSVMHSIQGSHASYNLQSVVDDDNGLIVHVEPVSDTNDARQFARQIDAANQNLPSPCKVACADAGYSDVGEMEKIDAQDITVIIPSQKQALHYPKEDPFDKGKFIYDPDTDTYTCPEGQTLRYSFTQKNKGKRQYRMKDRNACQRCPHFGQCTKSPGGRNIIRLRNEIIKNKLEAQYAEEDSQIIYKRRKTKVESVFGHIKRNLKMDSFLLRGIEGVTAESSILALCFNMTRAITLLGIKKLMEVLRDSRIKSLVPA